MDRRVIISGKGVNIPWGGVSKYHGKVGVYTIGGVIDIPLVGGQNTMDRMSIHHG